MTSWRRSFGLLRAGPTPKSVKLCLECLETRIVPDANSALGFVLSFESLALHNRPDQMFFLGEQTARNALNHAIPDAEGDQELETDLQILQIDAAVTPLVTEAGTLSLEAAANPATAAAGIGGLFLTIDTASFVAGMASVASQDLPQVFANPAATANGQALLGKTLPDFQIASGAIAGHVGVMPQPLTFDQLVQLFQQPDTVNAPPTAADDSYNVAFNTPLSENAATGVLSNDTDPHGEAISVANPGTFTGANGQLFLAADGSFTYTPNNLATGIDTFTYQTQDSHGVSNIATITFNITNPPPTAVNQAYNVASNTPLSATAINGVLNNDSDPDGEPISVANPGTTQSAKGQLILAADGSFKYTPKTRAAGADVFTYQVQDAHGVSNTATITFTISANPPPTVIDHTYAVGFETALPQGAPGVLQGGSDPRGEPLMVVNPGTFNSAKGQLILNANGSFTYTPTGTATGTDTFTYQATDATGVPSNTATITFTIANPPPTAIDQTYSVAFNTPLNQPPPGVLQGDSDPDGEPISVANPGQQIGAKGTLNLAADGSFTYTPNTGASGADVFMYQAQDAHGVSSPPNKITFNISNPPPPIDNDGDGNAADTFVHDPDGDFPPNG
jgi:VCBS repeat-containing protein